jgi:hypothetical protein
VGCPFKDLSLTPIPRAIGERGFCRRGDRKATVGLALAAQTGPDIRHCLLCRRSPTGPHSVCRRSADYTLHNASDIAVEHQN